MVDIRITYETLFDLLRREKNREELQQLEADFYEQVYAYLWDKQQIILKKVDDAFISVEREKLKIQFQNIRRIIKELYERREKKIINMAVTKARTGSDIIDTSTLLPSEREFFDDMVALFSKYKHEVLDKILNLKEGAYSHEKKEMPIASPDFVERDETEDDSNTKLEAHFSPAEAESVSYSEKADRTDKKKVKITTSLPKFMGKNGEILGPFEKDDVVELDNQIAELLLKKGRAEAF